MSEMDFGVFDEWSYNFYGSVPEARDVFEQSFREVRLEEALGYKYHFIIEHQSCQAGQMQSPAVYLAALAQNTSTIRIGGMIFLVPFYNPLRLAMDCAMVDQLSGGRLEFGAGSGAFEHEFVRWGLPHAERRDVTEEALEIIQKAWQNESLTYHGKYWNFEEAISIPMPYQKPHPPMWFAGSTKRSLELCVRNRYGVGLFLRRDPEMAETMDQWRWMLKEVGHKGPLPHSFLTRAVYVAETDEQAYKEVKQYIPESYSWGDERHPELPAIGSRETSPSAADDAKRRTGRDLFNGLRYEGIDFALENNIAYIGSPVTVIRKLEESQKIIGYDTFGGKFRHGSMPDDMVMNSLRLFGEKVVPAFGKVPQAEALVTAD